MAHVYSYAAPDAPRFDNRHEAVGHLAIVLRENDVVNPRRASGFVLSMATNGGGR